MIAYPLDLSYILDSGKYNIMISRRQIAVDTEVLDFPCIAFTDAEVHICIRASNSWVAGNIPCVIFSSPRTKESEEAVWIFYQENKQ